MPKVFISHSSQDRLLVERKIVTLLQQFGIETWYSRDDVQTATDWEKNIRHGLESCDWFLLVMSRQAIKSNWVKAELHWAIEHRFDHIIPILIKTCDPAEFHLMLSKIQYVDFRDDNDIRRARRKLLGIWGIDYEYKRNPHELRLVQGPIDVVGSIYPITNGKVIIGRRPNPLYIPECSVISINNDDFLARHHAMISLIDGRVFFNDLDSPNGSFINQKQVSETVILKDGDEIRLGMCLFVYRSFENIS